MSNDKNAVKPLSRILIVDDDPTIIQAMAKALVGLGTLQFAMSGAQALQRVGDHAPDLILVDAEMPGMSGFEVTEALRRDSTLVDIPVIFVTRHCEASFECAALSAGAVDFISKPLNPAVVAMRVKTHLRLKHANDRLQRLATVDGLTELDNRRSFNAALGREWRRAWRKTSPLALLMIDIDHFKRYNDHYGHAMGDAALTAVAQTTKRALRRTGDLAARYGGEEFVVLLPETDTAGAVQVAIEIRKAIADLAIAHAMSSVGPFVTVSIGIAAFDAQSSGWGAIGVHSRFDTEHAVSERTLLRAGDIALYAAKDAGRARHCVCPIDVALNDCPADPATTADPASPA